MSRVWTKEEMRMLTEKKAGSADSVEQMVTDELLKMGFSYSFIGTHYLHDSIILAVSGRLENFPNVGLFCRDIASKVCKKYQTTFQLYCSNIANAIEAVFAGGNINYILEVFKESYNYEHMTTTRKQFIMGVRQKILNEMQKNQPYTIAQLRLIIQGGVEKITDHALLKSISDIILCFSGETGN